MVRTLCAILLTAALGSTALAAGRGQPSHLPANLPATQNTGAELQLPAAPAAPMAAPVVRPSMSPQMMLEGLSAIKGSADGTETEIGVPPRVKRMLMGRQQGMIGGGDQGDQGKLQPIKDTGKFPYTTIGVVASGCTGTLVMQRFVLTAAWCVYDLKAKSFYKNLDFLPAMSGKQTPFGRIPWKNAWVAKGFVETGDLNFAYGLIELAQPIGDQAGWFGFGDEPKFNFKKIAVTGYPFAGVPELTMWETKCGIDAAEENAVFYRCSGDGKALSAMLGSPMWYKGKTDTDWKIVGIHITSQNDQMNSFWASRLNAATTETLIAWAKSADQTDTGTGTDDGGDNADDQDTGDDDVADNGDDNTKCTCDQQGTPQ
jgi:V8-like Glu-specific endopeptidase